MGLSFWIQYLQDHAAIRNVRSRGGGDAFVQEKLGREFGALVGVLQEAARSIEGSSALFLAVGIAGVLLGEVFKTSSLLFYAATTGALTAILAAALWQQVQAAGNAQTAAALAVAGFVAGTVYWMIAGYATPRRVEG
jgi:hypothetical protein